MRPKSFKCPTKWEERHPLIYDGVFFVPAYYDRYHEWAFPGWEDSAVFGRKAPIEIEYCTGNGAWIIEKARANPDRNWIAVEIQFERVRKIWSKKVNEKINNLFIVSGEALTFTRHYVTDHSFSAAYINFPDPWPKGKHAKKRLLQEPFITELARSMIPGGIATIVTDDPLYTSRISNAMVSHSLWNPLFESPYYITEWENYGSSYFEQLWRQQGLPIHYMQFCRTEKDSVN